MRQLQRPDPGAITMPAHARHPASLSSPDAAERAWLSEQLRAERLQRRLRSEAARGEIADARRDDARFAQAPPSRQTLPLTP